MKLNSNHVNTLSQIALVISQCRKRWFDVSLLPLHKAHATDASDGKILRIKKLIFVGILSRVNFQEKARIFDVVGLFHINDFSLYISPHFLQNQNSRKQPISRFHQKHPTLLPPPSNPTIILHHCHRTLQQSRQIWKEFFLPNKQFPTPSEFHLPKTIVHITHMSLTEACCWLEIKK